MSARLGQAFRQSAVADRASLDLGRKVQADALRREARWTSLILDRDSGPVDDSMPLGFVARVHRGLVTGANDFFVLTRDRAADLGLSQWCCPAITSAEEVLEADSMLRDSPERQVLLDLPSNLDRAAHPRLDAYLHHGETARNGEKPIAERYIPSHRRPWWYLGRWRPAPIVASYMARQAPRFALNPDGLALVNVVHGLYPRHPLTAAQLTALVAALNDTRETFRGSGRTYHGGLEKFEPGEMERLRVRPLTYISSPR